MRLWVIFKPAEAGFSVIDTAKELRARKTFVQYWSFVSSALPLFFLKQLSKKEYWNIFRDSTYLVNILWSSGYSTGRANRKLQHFSEILTHVKCFTVSPTLNNYNCSLTVTCHLMAKWNFIELKSLNEMAAFQLCLHIILCKTIACDWSIFDWRNSKFLTFWFDGSRCNVFRCNSVVILL